MPTTLQINLAPTDLPHLIYTLPHQCRQLGNQVDEILLTVDLHKSSGRFALAWEERLPGFLKFVEEQCALYPKMRIQEVDYSSKAMSQVSEQFFGGKAIPPKDCLGGPFYSYFSGFAHARYDAIFHIDSDMMFGGGSQTWIAEAKQLMDGRPEVLVCNPLPGPPTADGSLRSQHLESEPYTSVAFRTAAISTRVAFFDRSRLLSLLAPISLMQPSALRTWQARMEGNFPFMLPENILSSMMQQRGLMRIDFLGQEPGMWSIHPPYRTDLFYERLPMLIQSIEHNEIPDGQRGDHDLNDSMIDWSSIHKSTWRRKFGHVQLIYRHLVGSKV